MISYSFIIPHKNTPDLLNRMLDSIPTRDDIQVVVIDDNSDISHRPVINRKNVKLVYLTNKESKGAGHARNVGLNIARGKWILFADADDYYSEGFINELDKYKDTDLDILYFRVFIKHQAELNKKNSIDSYYNSFKNSNRNEYEVHRLGLKINEPWNKMFRHDFIIKNNIRFEEIPYGNDAWFSNYSGVCSSKIEVSDEIIYNYIIHEQGITQKRKALSTHIKAINSDTRRNYLKAKNNCKDLIVMPGFNVPNVLRDYGRYMYYILIFYKILTDRTSISATIRRFKNKWK